MPRGKAQKVIDELLSVQTVPQAVKHPYLVIVAFGKEQGTELAVQRGLVGLVAVFG